MVSPAVRHIGGLSPRVRGNRRPHRASINQRRSIPACAGEPYQSQAPAQWSRVYPRVCGGTTWGCARRRDGQGLSPRVRGNPPDETTRISTMGSIPACAGEPVTSFPASSVCRVYPRVCGGTRSTLLSATNRIGLSPRVRGNRATGTQYYVDDGSIPACAGEPAVDIRLDADGKVYPRVCGGTPQYPVMAEPDRGLSPRVRGNQHH